MMQCPKCGSEDTSVNHDAMSNGTFCCWQCHCDWTDWQQSEIDRLKQELANLEDSFRTIARENNEFEKELATEREKVRKLREFATLVKETSESAFQSSYRTNFNKYFLMFINKAAALLEETKGMSDKPHLEGIGWSTALSSNCANHRVAGNGRCPICMEEKIQSLRSRLTIAMDALREYANKANWQSAGSYKGEPSGVYLWNGWMRGIEGDPWTIAREGLKRMEEVK